MRRRGAVLRFLSLLWATVQLAIPAMSAVADGLMASEMASERIAHVEATSSPACPVVHPPDCGVCRYLSGCTALPPEPAPLALTTTVASWTGSDDSVERATALLLPDGRAPPVA